MISQFKPSEVMESIGHILVLSGETQEQGGTGERGEKKKKKKGKKGGEGGK